MKAIQLITVIISLAITTVGFQSCNAQGDGKAKFVNIDQKTFQTKMNEKDVVVIDVRTPGEIAESYIKGADLFINYNGNDFEKQINALDKNKKYIMYCRSGGRSSGAADYMVKNGFKEVYNLAGGISNYSGETTK
jgi:rhodanese-related sulfurtransferase